jgi:hypothetical protein
MAARVWKNLDHLVHALKWHERSMMAGMPGLAAPSAPALLPAPACALPTREAIR